MKKLLYRMITGALLLVWMGIIFHFSAQPATESQEISGSVSYRIVVTCNQMFDLQMAEDEIVSRASQIDYPIRKTAHMTEYAILAILAGTCALGYCRWGKKICGATLLAVAFYAATDEFHQLFVAGRAGRFSDVCIDTLGAAIGLLLFGIVLKLVKTIAKRRRLH